MTTSCRPRLLRSASSAAATLGEAGHRSSAEEEPGAHAPKSDSYGALPPPPLALLITTFHYRDVTVGTTDAVAMNSAVVHTVCGRLRRFKCARGLDMTAAGTRASQGRRSSRHVHGGPGGERGARNRGSAPQMARAGAPHAARCDGARALPVGITLPFKSVHISK